MIGSEVKERKAVYGMERRSGVIALTTDNDLGVNGYIVALKDDDNTKLCWTIDTDNLFSYYHSNLVSNTNYFWVKTSNAEFTDGSNTTSTMADSLKDFFG